MGWLQQFLIIGNNTVAMRDIAEWVGARSWTYTETDTYVEAWETDSDDQLYICDRLYDRKQTSFNDFMIPRYVVELDKSYRPSDRPTCLGTFWEEDEAVGFVRNITY